MRRKSFRGMAGDRTSPAPWLAGSIEATRLSRSGTFCMEGVPRWGSVFVREGPGRRAGRRRPARPGSRSVELDERADGGVAAVGLLVGVLQPRLAVVAELDPEGDAVGVEE